MLPVDAGVAHPVERHLAKVEVASSSLVTRSKKDRRQKASVFFYRVQGSNNSIQQSSGLLIAGLSSGDTLVYPFRSERDKRKRASSPAVRS